MANVHVERDGMFVMILMISILYLNYFESSFICPPFGQTFFTREAEKAENHQQFSVA